MIGINRSRVTRIGLDLGSRCMKAVQLLRRGGEMHLQAAVNVERTSDGVISDKDLQRLCMALDRAGFRGREAVIACPPAVIFSDLLELPPRSSGAPIEQLTRMEVQRAGRFETNPFELAYWELPSPPRAGGQTNVMAVAVKEADIHPLLTQLEQHGLEIAAMETNGTALARLFCTSAPDAIHAIVDCGASATSLVLAHAGTVIYKRRLTELSFDMLRRTVAQELELNDAQVPPVLREYGFREQDATSHAPQAARLRVLIGQHLDAVADEIESSLAYAVHRYPQLTTTGVVLAGGGAEVAEIDKYFGKRLSIDVRVARPADFALCSADQSEKAMSPAMLTATGLALNEAD